MTNNRNDNDMKAATSTPRGYSNNLPMTNDDPAKMSYAPPASDPSASGYPQLPLETDDSFQKTALKEKPFHNNKDRSVEHLTSPTHSSIDGRQYHKPYQHSVVEQGMNNPAMAYPRTQEQQVNITHAQIEIDPPTREQLLEDLNRMKLDLREKEGHLRNLQSQNGTNLATKDQQIYSLQE